jgi:PAS domain S-box-containing protein
MLQDASELASRLRLALDAGRMGTWDWDVAARELYWDRVSRRVFGLDDSAVSPSPDLFMQLVHPDDRARVAEATERLLASHEPLDHEFRIIRPDGVVRWIVSRGRGEFDAAGQPVRISGITFDATDRIEANEALRNSEVLTSGIVAIAADAIVSMDHEQRITMFNHGAEVIFGYASDEVIGQPLGILLPERFRGSHEGHVRQFSKADTTSRRMGDRTEIFARRKNGDEFPAEASISHLTIDGHSIYTAVLRDVTERKRTEELLTKSKVELEARVDERTRELSAEMQRREEMQAQLVRTQRMEAFGQLTGGIAHDFNNLLTVVIGNIELLDMRLTDEKDRAILRRAGDAAEMGARLTGRLLTFARRRQFETAFLNVNELVMGMADLLRRTLGEAIQLTTVLERKPWTVSVDAAEIENAILNLAINARDAMATGGKLVIETANVALDGHELSVESKPPAGNYLRLSVSDSGQGMSPDVMQRAFEPFFTTKAPGKGTGLGLSTIYGFAQQAGGAVSIYSEIGLGTTINIYLPQADVSGKTTAKVEPERAVPVSVGERVLLVEDNVDVRAVTKCRLEELGYRVIEAESGPEAVEILQAKTAIDVVFSDVVMAGGMSGFDVARWTREHAPPVKILLTSGYPDGLLRAEQSDSFNLKILRKPYSRGDLARALRRALDE